VRWWDALNAAIRLADGAKVERNAGVTLGYAEPFFRALTGINFIKAACRENQRLSKRIFLAVLLFDRAFLVSALRPSMG
jgi:hypothetical protein